MVSLKLLATVNTHLSQVKRKPDNDTFVLGGLAIVILIGDFYQFPPVVGRPLWEEAIITDEFHVKAIWNHFSLIITLTQQMRQHNDKVFHSLLTRARKKLLKNDDVDIFNSRIAYSILTNNINKNIVIVKQNKTRHIIIYIVKRVWGWDRGWGWIWTVYGQDVTLFPGHHFRTKKKGGQIVKNKELLTIQDGEGNCIEPRLLYYYGEMPACLLLNIYTKLGMVNRA